jgi:hypothetical protein
MEALQLSNFRQATALERLAGLLAADGRAGDSQQAYGRAARVYDVTGDAESATRCDALAAATR